MTQMDSIRPKRQPKRLIMEAICAIMLAMQKTERVLTMRLSVVRKRTMNAKRSDIHTP